MNDIADGLERFGEPVDGFYCPAEFWPALGYEGEARFVAIWWERGGDEAAWADGREMLVGANWPAYQALMAHNLMTGRWADELLGSSEDEATHRLVVDRESGRGWLVAGGEAEWLLREQWPLAEVAPLPTEDMQAWLEMVTREARRYARPSVEQIQARLDEMQARYEALVAVLAREKGKGTAKAT